MSFKHQKRNDIQWIRAIAILAVLGFHIWPKWFPNGYLGVDMFFVLSGYLMTSILSNSSASSLWTFYSRRIKRIFPSCLGVIALVLVIGYQKITFSHFTFLLFEATWSCLFVNNFSNIFHQTQYFELVSDFKFFLHTWSLGVEVQFYLMAPFLLRILAKPKSRGFRIFGIAFASILLQLTIPSSEASFSLVFCRIWQFLAGTAAFYELFNPLFKNSAELKPQINTWTYMLILSLPIIISFLPFDVTYIPFAPQIFRFLVTIFIGIFIQIGTSDVIYLPKILDTTLVYLGDASYSIYLIHWPVIIFFKYLYADIPYFHVWVIITITALSLVFHQAFEKPMNQQSWAVNGAFMAVCYAIIFYFTILMAIKEETVMSHNFITQDPIAANEAEAKSCNTLFYPIDRDELVDRYVTIRPPGNGKNIYGSYTFNTTSSNTTALIFGNSHAYFEIHGILDALRQSNFKKVYAISLQRCNSLVGNLSYFLSKNCESAKNAYDAFLKVARPDVIIYTGRIDHIKSIVGASVPLGPDYRLLEIQKSILHYASFTQKLILLQPSPSLSLPHGNCMSPLTAAQLIIAKSDLSVFKVPVQVYDSRLASAWKWVEEGAKACKNCRIAPTKNIFCDETHCSLIDLKSKLARYCDCAHITPTESLKLIPVLIDAINS